MEVGADNCEVAGAIAGGLHAEVMEDVGERVLEREAVQGAVGHRWAIEHERPAGEAGRTYESRARGLIATPRAAQIEAGALNNHVQIGGTG